MELVFLIHISFNWHILHSKKWHFHSVVPIASLEQKVREEAGGKEAEQGRQGGL